MDKDWSSGSGDWGKSVNKKHIEQNSQIIKKIENKFDGFELGEGVNPK